MHPVVRRSMCAVLLMLALAAGAVALAWCVRP